MDKNRVKEYPESGKGLWTIKILGLFNLYILLPGILMTIATIFLYFDIDIVESINEKLNGFLAIPCILLVLSRSFFLPYISTLIISIIYLYLLIKYRPSAKEWFVFALIMTFFILGLISVEDYYTATMGI